MMYNKCLSCPRRDGRSPQRGNRPLSFPRSPSGLWPSGTVPARNSSNISSRPVMSKTILALGADIKNRFLLAEGKSFKAGPEMGDLGDAENYERFRRQVRKAAGKVSPGVIACDLHPAYFSTRFAKELSILDTRYSILPVQHHHAHIASVMEEYSLKGPVIGVSFDGTGYGTDGNIWGGEFLLVDKKGFKRLAHLKYRMMPGGDKAVSEPWRMVLSVLGPGGAKMVKGVSRKQKGLVLEMMSKEINSPLTSSAGRLFDAAAALLWICTHASRESEGPIKLEAMCDKKEEGSYPFDISRENGMCVIGTDGLFRGMVRDMGRGKSKKIIAARFHNSMGNIIVEVVKKLSKKTGVRDIALSGGVFQNGYLKERALRDLIGAGYQTFINRSNPVNDLNIAMGQYFVACHWVS